MSIAITESELYQIMRDSPFLQGYDLRVHSLGEGECALTVPYQKHFDRPDGIINGPLYMTAADCAMWFAIMTQLGKTIGAVTVEMKTNFLRAARQEDVLCTARVLKMGRRLVYGVAECANARGELLTHHTMTYMRE